MMKWLRNHGPLWDRFRRETSGTALVEMAFFTPIILILLMGVWDFGSLAKEYSRVTDAANAGAQFGMQFPEETAAIEQLVRDELGPTSEGASVSLNSFCECPGGGAAVDCESSCAGFSNPAKFMSVQVQSSFETLFEYPYMANPVDITKQVVIRTQ